MEVLEFIGRHYPPEIINRVKNMLETAGFSKNPYVFVVQVTIFSLILFIFSLFLSYNFIPLEQVLGDIALEIFSFNPSLGFLINALFFSILVVGLFMVLLSSYYSMLADKRKEEIEKILPDFLTLVSSNVRSGMNLDQALWNAAKPEFGILSVEVKNAIKLSFSGQPIDESLDYLASRFNSQMFRRAINIIKHSIHSGGEIAKVLERIANESSEFLIIKQDIRSNLVIYVIFLIFAAGIGIPAMLAVSSKLLFILEKAFSMVVDTSYNRYLSSFNFSSPPITSQQFYYFSLLMILISSLTTSFIIGATYSGKKTDGIKFLPLLILGGYTVFFLSLWLLDWFFTSVIPIQ